MAAQSGLSWAECARKEHDVGNRKQVLLLIDDVLALEGRGLEFTASTPLLGRFRNSIRWP